MLNLELRWRMPKGYNLTGFYDYGHITINPNNNFAGAAALNDYGLRGAGLSLAWQSSKGPTVKATYSHRIGDNPNPTATGSDQDGSLFKNRLWLTASFPFSGGGSSSEGGASAPSEAPISRVSEAVPSEPISAASLPARAAPQAVRDEPVEPPATQPTQPAPPDKGGVSVSMDRQASKNLAGLINVSVPNDMHSFSFPLPAEMASSNGAIRVHSGIPGKWVPSWLKFNKKTGTFTATAVPKDALPAQVVITTGGLSSTLVIAERVR